MAYLGLQQSRPNKTPQQHNTRQPCAPGTNIVFDPLLIRRLQSDHQRMLGIFTQTQMLLTTHVYEGVKRKLGELRITLQDHLMTANVKLYVYISRFLSNDEEKAAMLNDYRRNMQSNSSQIMDFLRTYSSVKLDDAVAKTFQVELLVIGSALVQRIELEQSTLFPLYRNSY
jgi:regulator of sigma D